MQQYARKIGLISAILISVFVNGFVLPTLRARATVHAQAIGNGVANSGVATSHQPAVASQGLNQAPAGQTNSTVGQAHLAAAQLKACQNRENAINNIMTRIDTRAQNQITLFSTIAKRVESFYLKQGKTVGNYDQLVAAINTAATQANTDLGAVRTNSTFSCSTDNPKGVISSFQSYLKTEITDLQNYRMTVKNLIVAVASANGVTMSASTPTPSPASSSTNPPQGGN